MSIMKRDEITKFYNQLDRSLFIDNAHKQSAGQDRPLPIGYGQTISQPSLVLEMTLQLELDERCEVLEIGTGSGYQTALLSEFAKSVYTVERIGELSVKAQKRLGKLGFDNIHYRVGDGSEGWSEHAPYERIITTAAAGEVPHKLIRQLKPGGIAIAPVGPRRCQELLKITKDENGTVHTETLCLVTFVEMKGEYGWNS